MTNTIVDIDPVEYSRREIEQVHALCDRAKVARVINGERLSMSQRVTVLEQVCAGLVQRLGMEPLTTIH